jgi:hypothetical protein
MPKWLNHLNALEQSLTMRQSATDAGVHRNTSFRWRHRFMNWISQERPASLYGITEAASLENTTSTPANPAFLMNISVYWTLVTVPGKCGIS